MFSSFHRTLARIRAVFHSNDLDRDLVLELESHIQILVEQHIRKGASREEAQRLARIELGGIAQLREAHREVRALPLPDAVLQDIPFACFANLPALPPSPFSLSPSASEPTLLYFRSSTHLCGAPCRLAIPRKSF